MTDRVAVGSQQMAAPRQGHRQREDGAAWHMKIRHHRVDQLEAETRKDEKAGEALSVAGDGVRFERARTAGADRDNAATDAPA